MRKMIFALMLAIAASVCMMKAACLMQAPEAMYQPFETVSGTLTSIGFPCEGEEPCPPCLTIALVTDAKTYYLSTSDAQMQAQLDELEMQLPLRATISGTPFVNGSFDFIKVQSVSVDNSLLPSLCDEWNVLEISNVTCGYCEEYRTYNFHLTTDTVIGGLLYSQLIKDGAYKGALREGNNRDIYCVPAGCSQEYLLYAFNAQVGDSLKNIWVGGYSSWIPDVRSAIVSEIKQTTPRTIELEVHYYEAPDAYEESIRNLTWIEGIGMPFGPMGAECSVFNGCGDSKAKLLLCAYKNGEQVYVSDMGEQYGCEYSTQDEKKKIIGTWQVYKETLSGNDYNEHGEIEYLSRTRDVNDSRTYNFDDSTLLIVCPTCYYTPKHYVLTPKGPTTWNLWVENMFTIQQKPSDPAEEGFSTITIHQLTGNLMEWEYIAYGGDEGPITWYQYLRRVGTQDSDTIPLYAQDDSGSSTVDPVDPNQVVATLQGDQLTIHENMGVDITYSLQYKTSAQTPSQHRAPQSGTFRDEVTIHITESGEYLLQLTNPSWGYTIFGQFYYAPQGIVEVPSSLQGEDRGRLILQNGQLLILRGERVYTLQGQEVR